MSGKLVELNGGKSDPKQFLAELLENFDKEFPNSERVLVVVGSKPDADDMIDYGMSGNRLTRADKLWLLEMGKHCLFNKDE